MTVKESVLEELQQNKESYVSGEALSEQLGVSRAAVWKAIKSLRSEGYPIDAVTNKGYILSSGASVITAEALRRALPTELRDNTYLIYDILDSTNLQAKRLVLDERKPVGNGTVVIARQQTAGRGRLGRGFFSPEEGLYLSIIIKPEFDPDRSTLVTVAAAVAVADAIEEVCSCEAKIKWVNDVYVGNRKVCGILTEATTDFESGNIDSLVIGIGINTSTAGFPEELLPIAGAVGKGGLLDKNARDKSLTPARAEDKDGYFGGGTPLDANELAQLAAAVIKHTLQNVEEIGEVENIPSFIGRYRDKSLLTGKTVKVYKGLYRKDVTSELNGLPARVLGISDMGGLQVIYTDGTRETLTTGEVSVRLED